ncbi:hypothetical protein V8E36_003309 [Tilletia maclaganii]
MDTAQGAHGDVHTGTTAAAVEGVFIARFHVRTGNSLSFVWPPALEQDLTKASAEWKALPSGSHAVERDTIYFTLSNTRTAVACFRNVALAASADDAQQQRGARMLSIGAIFNRTRPAPALLLRSLDKIADSIAASSPDGSERAQEQLKNWFQSLPEQQSAQLKSEAADTYEYTALSHLPALSSSLGPLLPPLLKQLAAGCTRLLIFSNAPLLPAASLAYNLRNIVHAAQRSAGQQLNHPQLVMRDLVTLHDIVALSEEGQARTTTASTSAGWIAFTSDKILLDKCSLFDIVLDLTPLQAVNGNKAAASPRNAPSSSSTSSSATIGTKPRLSIVSPISGSSASQPKLVLKETSWTTQEYAEMRLVEDKVKRRLNAIPSLDQAPSSPIPIADPPVAAAQRVSAVRKRSSSSNGTGTPALPTTASTSLSPPRRTTRTRPISAVRTQSRGVFLNLLAMLRYVFAQTLWFFPSTFWTPASASTSALTLLGASTTPGARRRGIRAIAGGRGGGGGGGAGDASETTSLAESAFILPLGVRPDGGLRASVVLDPDEDEDDEDEQETESVGEETLDEEAGLGSGTETAGQSEATVSLLTPRPDQHRLLDLDNDQAGPSSSAFSSSGPVHAGTARRRHSALVELDDAEVPGSPDPFLAACGAASSGVLATRGNGSGAHLEGNTSATGLRIRNSHASLRHSAASPGAGAGESDDDEEGEEDDDEAQSEANELARSLALARTLQDAWTDWLAVLFVEVAALVSSTSPTEQLDGTDLASIGLSTRNGADCALVRAVGRNVLQREVGIRRWTWTSVFR